MKLKIREKILMSGMREKKGDSEIDCYSHGRNAPVGNIYQMFDICQMSGKLLSMRTMCLLLII